MSWKPVVHLCKWIARVCAILLLLLGLLFGLAQTEMGKRQVAKWLASALSRGLKSQVKLGKFDGLLPFDVQLSTLTVSDKSGKWLEVEKIVLRLSPASLLKAKVGIKELSVNAVWLDRLPPSHKKDRDYTLPSWPKAVPSLTLERFSIERLTIGPAVAGEEAVFTVESEITADKARGFVGSIRFERIDGRKALASMSWTLKGRVPELLVNVKVEEESGVLSSLLGFPGMGPLTIELEGEGPITGWQAKLSAGLGEAMSLEAAIGLVVQEGVRVTGDGAFRFSPSVLAAPLRTLMANPDGRFFVDAGYRRREEFIIHQARVETDGADLELMGRIDLQRRHLDGEFSLEVNDLSFLGRVVETSTGGRLISHGVLLGAIRQPEVTLSLSVYDPQLAGFRAESMENEFHLKPLEPITSYFPGLNVRWEGNVDGLSQQDGPTLPEKHFSWSLAARIPGKETIFLDDLKLTAESLLVEASGQFHPVSLSYEAAVTLELNNLERFSGVIGKKVSGKAFLRSRIQGNGQAASFAAGFEGHLDGLGPLPPILSVLLGSQIFYGGQVELGGAFGLRIPHFEIRSSALQTKGNVSIDLSTKDLSGRYHLDLPSLAVFSRPLGRALAGSAEIDGEIKGTVSAPELLIMAKGHQIGIQEIKFQEMAARFDVTGLPGEPKGRVNLDLQYSEHRLAAATDFVLDDNRIRLSNLSMVTSGTKLTGNLDMNLQTRITEGSLQGRSPDLSSFSAILGEKIGGKASFKARLLPERQGQGIVLEVHGTALEIRNGKVGDLRLNLLLSDALKAPTGTGEVKVKSVQRGGLSFDTVELKAQGEVRKIAFTASASDRHRDTFELKAQGVLKASGDDAVLTISSFKGRYGEYPLALAKEAFIRRLSDGYAFEDLALGLGQGRLDATGSFRAETVSVAARFQDLPLEPLRLVGSPNLSGSVSGEIRMTGPPDRPEASVTLRSTEVRLLETALQDLPPAVIDIDTDLKDGRVRAVVSVKGLTERPIEAEIEHPVILSLSPLALSIPPTGKLHGRTTATAKLSHVMSFFPMEYQSFEGLLSLDLALSGHVGAPEVTGRCRIEKGAYENARSGTILKDMEIHVAAEGRKVSITQARATDGEKGIVEAQGRIDMAPQQDFPFQVDIDLKEVTLVRLDRARSEVDGHVELSGSLKDFAFVGKVAVGPTELRLPNRMPPEVKELEVIEINRRTETTQTESSIPKKATEPGRLRLDLELDLRGPVFVRGRGLDSEWKGKLRITGTAREPIITGTLSTVRGRFNLFGKSLSLTRGTITFEGNTPPSPFLDVVSEGKQGDMTAYIGLSGNLSALSVTLESDPPLPSDEVLSRLLFDRSVTELNPIQGAKLAVAVSALTGTGGGVLDVMDRTRQLVGLDDLDVKESDETEGEAAVRAGKYLTEDVYVEVEQGIGSTRGKVSVEYEVRPDITVETEAGSDAEGGIGLNWKWDY